MVNITQSNLVITGLEKVFWKGKQLDGLVSVDLKKNRHHLECKMAFTKGVNDPLILDEIRATGITIKEVK